MTAKELIHYLLNFDMNSEVTFIDENNIERAISACENADLVIVVGTSLNVYPAAGFLRYVKGKLAIINKQHTSYDSYCDVIIHDGIGKVLSIACEDLLKNKNR